MTDAANATTIVMVLDRSGSMQICREATIAAVNTYLKDSKADAALKDADFELVIFDSQSIDTIRDGKMVDIAELTAADFVPRSSTPLLDAIGRGVDKIDAKLLRNNSEKAVLVVVTDGEENQSRKHTYESIQAIIADRQDKGWLVLFLGAGLSSAQQGTRMGIRSANVANIGLDEAALVSTMSFMSEANAAYASSANLAEAKLYAGSEKFSRSMRMAMGDKSGGEGLVDADAGPLEGLKNAFDQRARVAKDTWDKAPPRDAWK